MADELRSVGLCEEFVPAGVALWASSEGTCETADGGGLNLFVNDGPEGNARTLDRIERSALEFQSQVLAVVGENWIVTTVVGRPAAPARERAERVQSALGGTLRDDVSGASTMTTAEAEYVAFLRQNWAMPFEGTDEQVAILGHLVCIELDDFAPDYDSFWIVERERRRSGPLQDDLDLARDAAPRLLCPQHLDGYLEARQRHEGAAATTVVTEAPRPTAAPAEPRLRPVADLLGLSGSGESAARPPQSECTDGASICFYLNRISWEQVIDEITAAIRAASGQTLHDGFEIEFFTDPPEAYNGPDRAAPGQVLYLSLPIDCFVTVRIEITSETTYAWTVTEAVPTEPECGA